MEMLYVMYMYLILWDIPGTINDKLKVVYPSKTHESPIPIRLTLRLPLYLILTLCLQVYILTLATLSTQERMIDRRKWSSSFSLDQPESLHFLCRYD